MIIDKIGAGQDYVFAHIFLDEGKHSSGIKISTDAKQIASFIVKTQNAYKVIFTNCLDKPEIITSSKMKGVIEECRDQKFMNVLLEEWTAIRMRGEEPVEINVLDYGVDKETFDKLGEGGIKNWYNDTFGINL